MTIERIGVVGGGLMGSGIAEVNARAGLSVVVVEVSDEAARAARERIEASLQRAVDRGKLSEPDRDATLEAITVSTQVTGLLKGLFGRARPYAAAGDAGDFDLGGGFGSATRRSFPSGHTSMAFTLASVVSAETAHRWPRARRVVAPLAYAAATGVGLARMYNDKHWASDVALGAAIGTLSGRMVVRYAHARPRNWVDRIGLGFVRGR